MAKGVKTNQFVSVNGVDISAKVRSFEFSGPDDDPQDSAAMGDRADDFVPGLETYGATLEAVWDETLDAQLFALLVAGTKHAVLEKADNAAASATNVKRTGTMILSEYTPFSGGPNDLHVARATFESAGVAVARATSD